MKSASENQFSPFTVETAVRIIVLYVDRGQVDPNNILDVF